MFISFCHKKKEGLTKFNFHCRFGIWMRQSSVDIKLWAPCMKGQNTIQSWVKASFILLWQLNCQYFLLARAKSLRSPFSWEKRLLQFSKFANVYGCRRRNDHRLFNNFTKTFAIDLYKKHPIVFISLSGVPRPKEHSFLQTLKSRSRDRR